jgi:hypothetical protein
LLFNAAECLVAFRLFPNSLLLSHLLMSSAPHSGENAGATSPDKFKKFIEKDPALERRFQQVI